MQFRGLGNKGLVQVQRSPSKVSDHIEVFKIVPEEVQGILFDFLELHQKTHNSSLQQRQKEFGNSTRALREGPEATPFEEDPVEYLIHSSRSVPDFSDRLFRNLRVLRLKRDEPLTVKEFEKLVKYVYHEEPEKQPPTRKMLAVFRGLLAHDPFTSRRDLAKHLSNQNRKKISEDAIRWHIAEMMRRFMLFRLIAVDYYKLGLSTFYLFLKGLRNQNGAFSPTVANNEGEYEYDGGSGSYHTNHAVTDSNGDKQEQVKKTIPGKYLLRADKLPTNIANEFVSYQSHTPPWNRRYEFLKECESQAKEVGVSFITEEPDIFYATGRKCFYNLKPFDFTTGQWTIKLRDLRFLIKNEVMTGSKGVSPPYDFRFGVDRQKEKQQVIEFDERDLQICEQFWACESVANRFATVHAVSKALGVSSNVVAKRLKWLRANQVAYFYYWLTLGLPSALYTLLITKDTFLLNNFQSILNELPVSSVVTLESLRDNETRGLFCHTYIPLELYALENLVKTTFLAEEGVNGFCVQGFPGSRASHKLDEYYDPKRKWWKWKNITT